MKSQHIRTLGLIVGFVAVFGMASIAAGQPLSNQQLSSQIEGRLSKDNAFQNVRVAVAQNVVRLSGMVPSLWAKTEAIAKARESTSLRSVVSDALTIESAESDGAIAEEFAEDMRRVTIPGPSAAARPGVSSSPGIAASRLPPGRFNRPGSGFGRHGFGVGGHGQLGRQLHRAINGHTSNSFYGIFDYVGGWVDNGVVVLTGYVTHEFKANRVARLVSRVHGVKEIQNQIEVLPVSTFDDELRMTLATQIYGHELFWNYALQNNPPLRIIVNNLHVTLRGVVNSAVDKSVAGNFVRHTVGVLTVQNDLEVAGSSEG